MELDLNLENFCEINISLEKSSLETTENAPKNIANLDNMDCDEIESFVTNLMNYIYSTIRIKYVYVIDNKRHIENFYRDGNEEIKPTRVATTKIFYKLEYHPDSKTNRDLKSWMDELVDTDEDNIFDEKALGILKNNTMNNIYIKCNKNIILINPAGINNDERGANHTSLKKK